MPAETTVPSSLNPSIVPCPTLICLILSQDSTSENFSSNNTEFTTTVPSSLNPAIRSSEVSVFVSISLILVQPILELEKVDDLVTVPSFSKAT